MQLFQQGNPNFTTRLIHLSIDDLDRNTLPNTPQFIEVKDLVDSRQVDTKLAYLMGALYAGRSKELGERYTVQLFHSQQNILAFVKDALANYFPNSTPKIGPARSGTGFALSVSSRSLTRLFNFHTNSVQELPRHLLGDHEEKVSFLRGLFSFAGSVSDQGIALNIRLGKKSAVQIALLLDEIGVTPLVSEVDGKYRVLITDKLGLQEFDSLGLLVDKQKSRVLRELIASKTGNVSVHPRKWYEFRDAYLAEPKKPLAQIASAIGVPETTLRYWAKGNQPRAITRSWKLHKLAQEMRISKSDCLVYAYRELKFSLSASLEIVQSLSYKKLRQLALIGEALGWKIQGEPEKLRAVEARFGELMADLFEGSPPKECTPAQQREIKRRERLIDWAKRQGVSEVRFSTLSSKLLEKYLPSMVPVTIKIHRQLGLEQYGVDIEAAHQIAALTLYDCICTTFDPAKQNSLKTYASQAVKFKLYNELARVSTSGRKVVKIAQEIAADPKSFQTSEEIIKAFGCKKNTAIHALHLAGSESQLVFMKVNDNEKARPQMFLEDKAQKNPVQSIEESELFQRIMSLATLEEKPILEAIYSDGMKPGEAGRALGIKLARVEQTLAEFYRRARGELSGLLEL